MFLLNEKKRFSRRTQQIAKACNSIIEWISILSYQFSQIGFGKTEILQEDLKYLTSLALLIFPLYILIYLLHFYVNDRLKTPHELYVKYRFGMIAAFSFLFAVVILVRKSHILVRAAYLSLATLLSLVQAWSMTWGPRIQSKWIVWLPTFVFIFTSNSFIFSAAWILFLIYLTRPFWQNRDVDRALFSDTNFALFVLLFSQFVRRIWIRSKVTNMLFEKARNDLIIEQEIFHNQLKRFISPVYIARIEQKKRLGSTAVEAIDAVLRRRKTTTAVLYSDLRNFSERSIDPIFIEVELIPSAISIIDEAESNLGIAKQIGDAILIYFDQDDPEESLLRACREGFRSAFEEVHHIKKLGRKTVERYFSITYGVATVGNMASDMHREATIIGQPVNLAARIDSLTKNEAIVSKILNWKVPCLLLSEAASNVIQNCGKKFEVEQLSLSEFHLTMKSFPNEKNIFLFPATKNNILQFNKLLEINNLRIIQENLYIGVL